MEKTIKIDASSNWPEISFNAIDGQLWIKGKSIIENPTRFYEPLTIWVEDYCKSPAKKTELHLKLEYFNTSTSKYLLSIIEMLEQLYDQGNDVSIYWYSIDEEMADLGKDYNAMIDIPFQFLEFSK